MVGIIAATRETDQISEEQGELRELRELRAKELPLRKTEESLMAQAILLTSFPVKAASLTSCYVIKIKWKLEMEEKDFVFLFKIRKFSKNASWIPAHCFRDEIQKTFSSELKNNTAT